MSNQPTDFLESNAILYAQDGKYDEARDCLRKMLPGELRALENAASDLIDLIKEVQAMRRGHS